MGVPRQCLEIDDDRVTHRQQQWTAALSGSVIARRTNQFKVWMNSAVTFVFNDRKIHLHETNSYDFDYYLSYNVKNIT